MRIANEIGATYRLDVVEVADAEHARQIATTLNADRHHLTAAQRREHVAALRE